MKVIKYYLKKYWYIAVGVAIAILATAIISGGSSTLPAYIPQATPTPSATPSPTPTPLDFTMYENGEGFSFKAPPWQKVEQGDKIMFVERGSGTTLTVIEMDYTPEINSYSSDEYSRETIESGAEPESFESVGLFSILASNTVRQGDNKITTYDFFRWTPKKIYLLKFKVSSVAFEYHYKYFVQAIQSITVPKEDDYPEGYAVFYNKNLGCEFLYPLSWQTHSTDSSYTVVNPQTGSTLQFSFVPYDPSSSLVLVDQVTYSKIIGQNKANFMLKKYSNTGEQLLSESTYNTANGIWIFKQCIVENPMWRYIFSFDMAEAASGVDAEVFETVKSSFKYYYTYVPTAPPATTSPEASPAADMYEETDEEFYEEEPVEIPEEPAPASTPAPSGSGS